jgi:hypothetical protein
MRRSAHIMVCLLGLTALPISRACSADGAGSPAAASGNPLAAGPVMVHTASGRVFTGEIAPATDGTLLWISQDGSSTTISRPIAWPSVVKATILGQVFTGDDLQRRVQQVRETLPPPGTTAAILKSGTVPFSPSGSADGPQNASPPLPKAERVVHLVMDATLAGWGDTAEPDGLAVRICPVDRFGRLTPVWGTLEVDLTGRHDGITAEKQRFANLGRWTVEVRPDDFGPSGALYPLDFQAVHPEYDTSVIPRGTVHARLSVPGQGTFDATQSTVRIRASSPMRDDLQRATGQRFFPQERSGRPKPAPTG